MPNLKQMLQTYDPELISMLAEKWDFSLQPGSKDSRILQFLRQASQPGSIADFLKIQSPELLGALQTLAATGGMQPWADFSRRCGDIQTMGIAQRNQNRPDQHPQTISEALYYSGLIGKAFLKDQTAGVEYAFIPDEILPFLQVKTTVTPMPFGRPARKEEAACQHLANSAMVDDCCTFLAAGRMGLQTDSLQQHLLRCDPNFLSALLLSNGLTDQKGRTRPEAARAFLEKSRSESLRWLTWQWLTSPGFNELHLLEDFTLHGNWQNRPLETRRAIVNRLAEIPPQEWWSIRAFIQDLKEKQPDFQRSGAEYEIWLIQRKSDRKFAHGFQSWNEVEGALVYSIITRALHWLGLVDLASPSEDAPPAAFRWNNWSKDLLQNTAPTLIEPPLGALRLNSNGILSAARTASRPARYQAARFLEWKALKADSYQYRITPASLEEARRQNLQASQLIQLLHTQAEQPLPPGILQAIQHWERDAGATLLQQSWLLRLESAEVMQNLQKTGAARYILEELTPTTCLIRAGGIESIQNTLAEMGYLISIQKDSSS